MTDSDYRKHMTYERTGDFILTKGKKSHAIKRNTITKKIQMFFMCLIFIEVYLVLVS